MRKFFLALSFAVTALASSSSVTVSLSGSAVPLSGTSLYADRVSIRTIPGNANLSYIGMSSMDIGTLADTAAILAANPGVHSDQYEIVDHTGEDGIDLNSIYVAGSSGDKLLVEVHISGTTATDKLQLWKAGKVGSGYLFGFSTTNRYEMIRFQSLPGSTAPGEVRRTLKDPTNPQWDGTLLLAPWANDPTKDSGHADFVEHYANVNGFKDEVPTSTCTLCYPKAWRIGSQQVLMAMWRRVTSGGSSATPAGTNEVYVLNSTSTPYPVNLSGVFFEVYNMQARSHYGHANKIYLGENGLSGADHAMAHLWPNTDSTSESVRMGVGCQSSPADIYFESAADYPQLDWTFVTGQLTGCHFAGLNRVYKSDKIIPSTTTPTAISRGMVSSLSVRVIPGQTGKMYIGGPSMNKATLADVYAVLYPNGGAHSESFELVDIGDGIDTDQIYVLADVANEDLVIGSLFTGSLGAPVATPLTLSGTLLSHPGGAVGALVASTSTPVKTIRTQVIPGQSGRVRFGTASMTQTQWDPLYQDEIAVLWPNSGSLTVGEAHSEKVERNCLLGNNCLDLVDFRWFPEVSGENLLLFTAVR